MIKDILIKIAYLFYPKGIDNMTEKESFLQSNEYKKLSNTLKSYNNYPQLDDIRILYNTLCNKFDTVTDNTLLHWEDRCISYQIPILSNNTLTIINLQISLLIPFYFIYVTDCSTINVNGLYNVPVRNVLKEQIEYFSDLLFIKREVEDVLKFRHFDETLLDNIISGISFRDIKFGEFTFYNAFFLDEKRF